MALFARRPGVLAALVVAVATAACSDPIAQNEAKLRLWLDQRARTLALNLRDEPPAPVLVDRTSRLIAGLEGFAVGALVGAAFPWISGSPPSELRYAGEITAISAVIGAVAGAAYFAWNPEESIRSLTEVPPLSSLLEPAVAERRFERALQSAVVAAAGPRVRHRLRAIDPRETAGWTGLPDGTDGLITLRVQEIGLLEEGGDPPRFAFLVAGKTYLSRDWRPPAAPSRPRGLAISRWQFEGDAHTLADLAADGGALFEAEKRAMIDRLAAQIVGALGGVSQETATPEGDAESPANGID